MADVETRALFLTDRCDFVLLHCGTPMRAGGSRCSWLGAWPNGTQTLVNVYDCQRCDARFELTVVEPDRPIRRPAP